MRIITNLRRVAILVVGIIQPIFMKRCRMNGFVGLFGVPIKIAFSGVVAATSFLGGTGENVQSLGAIEGVPAMVTQYSVAPRATDAAIDDWLQPHQVYIANGVEHKGYLYLFLPGSYGWATGQDLNARARGAGRVCMG